MARRVAYLAAVAATLTALILSAACGVKAPPLPRSEVAPEKVRSLEAAAVADGVQVVFPVPQVDRPDRRIVQAFLYYGYLPLTGRADCPPCPPKLRRYHTFHLEGDAADLMDGGYFRYLDRSAPMGQEAIYQVVISDARGRDSEPSNIARAPRVEPPAAPGGLAARPGDTVVEIAWEGEKIAPLAQDAPQAKRQDHMAGWVVYRQSPAGEEKIVMRPLTSPELADKSVTNGVDYAYAVAAVREIKGRQVEGPKSAWVKAKPQDQTPPSAPQGLNGASTKQGMYLRFTPSPEQDTKGYQIYRAAKGGKYEMVSSELVTENTFVDSGVKARKVYLYKVKAVDEAGNVSEFSEELEIEHIP